MDLEFNLQELWLRVRLARLGLLLQTVYLNLMETET